MVQKNSLEFPRARCLPEHLPEARIGLSRPDDVIQDKAGGGGARTPITALLPSRVLISAVGYSAVRHEHNVH